MPMYHFRCPHGHEFERVVAMADPNNPVPCGGMVPMLLNDEEVELLEGGGADPEFIDSVRMESVGPGGEEEGVWVRDVPCILKASMEIAHSNPSALTYRSRRTCGTCGRMWISPTTVVFWPRWTCRRWSKT